MRPTIAGIRAGRDEVLDRALAWVRRRLKDGGRRAHWHVWLLDAMAAVHRLISPPVSR